MTALALAEAVNNEQQNMPAPATALRLAIPKKGRLKDAFAGVMADAGLTVERASERQDFGVLCGAEGPAVEVLLLSALNALNTIQAEATQLAVVGYNTLAEFNARSKNALGGCTATPLGFGQCALWIAAPDAMMLDKPQDLRGLRIATSHPAVLQQYLDENGVTGATVVDCDGGVEGMVRLGLADAVCDLVQTGDTLTAHGLSKRLLVLRSEAVLVEAPVLRQEPAAMAGLNSVAARLRRAALRTAL